MTPAEIVALRRGLALTQHELADLLGVHAMTVSKWERGSLGPDAHRRMLLRVAANALEHDPDIGQRLAYLRAHHGAALALADLFRAAYP